jgi:hypothetical protein
LDYTKVDIDLEDGFVSKPAVSSFLVPDSAVSLKLVMTRAAYSARETDAVFKSGTIESVLDNQAYVLSGRSQKDYLELYSTELKPVTGGIYKMRVETRNPATVLESTDTIPDITPILDAEILPVEKSSNQVGRVTFKPNPDATGTLYYELAILLCDKSSLQPTNIFYQIPITSNNQIITREDYYPSLLLIGAMEPQSFLFRINHRSEAVSIDFIYRSGSAWGNATGVCTFDHDIRIELRTVSYGYFNYKTSLYKQINAANGDLLYGMAAPVTVKGNINGGLGVFAGYSKSDTTISVAGRTGLND